MYLIQAGALMLPAVLVAFAGYRAGWSLAIIVAAMVGAGAFMWPIVYWGVRV
jgi:hypothetical protein